MTTENLPSGGTLRAFRRVVLVDGVIVLAGADQSATGHVTCEGISYGDGQPVHLREPEGTALVEIVGDCKDGDKLYAAHDGKVSAKGKVQEGIASGESSVGGLAWMKWSGNASGIPKINEPHGLPKMTLVDSKVTEPTPGNFEVEQTYKLDDEPEAT